MITTKDAAQIRAVVRDRLVFNFNNRSVNLLTI